MQIDRAASSDDAVHLDYPELAAAAAVARVAVDQGKARQVDL